MFDGILHGAPTRRQALGQALGLGGASAAGLLLGAGAMAAEQPTAVPTAKLPFDDPRWNREQSARLEARTDGEQVFGHADGAVYGVRPGEAVRHILNFEVFSTIRTVRRPDGDYDRMSKEVVFYLDPATGEILDSWDNPYINERVRVVDIANDPYNWVIRDWVTPPALPGVDLHTLARPADAKPFRLNWTEFGPDTLVVEEGGSAYYPNRLDPAKWPRESAGAFIQASEFFRYFIRREDVENASLKHVPSNGVWIRITPWLPWMLMGQAPGHCLYNGKFRRYATLDYYKPAVIARLRERYPHYLQAPTRWYGPSLSSLEHYALEQKPAPAKR